MSSLPPRVLRPRRLRRTLGRVVTCKGTPISQVISRLHIPSVPVAPPALKSSSCHPFIINDPARRSLTHSPLCPGRDRSHRRSAHALLRRSTATARAHPSISRRPACSTAPLLTRLDTPHPPLPPPRASHGPGRGEPRERDGRAPALFR